MKRYSLDWVQDDYNVFDRKTRKIIKKGVTETEGKKLIKKIMKKNKVRFK